MDLREGTGGVLSSIEKEILDPRKKNRERFFGPENGTVRMPPDPAVRRSLALIDDAITAGVRHSLKASRISCFCNRKTNDE